MPCRIAATAAIAFAVLAAPATATDFCVPAATRAGCVEMATLAAALDAANDDAALDRVYVGQLEEQATGGPFSDVLGRPVEILGAGAERTVLVGQAGSVPAVRLSDPRSQVRWVTVARPPGASGPAIELLAGAEVADATVRGGILALPGGDGDAPARALRLTVVSEGQPALVADRTALVAESVDAAVTGAAAGLLATCSADRDAALSGRHLTVTGTMGTAARSTCDAPRRADVVLRNSVLAGTYGADGVFDREGTAVDGVLASAWSWHDSDADVTATDPLPTAAGPGFVSESDRRLRPDSALVDAGDPAPLAMGEGLVDAGGLARVADGSADGVVRRDVGAHERQPPPLDVPPGNVLTNPGAEAAEPLLGWSGAGSFEAVAFGADDFFPTRAAAAAMGAGARMFAGGSASESKLVQRIDVAGSAAAIDGGGATASLSALLGGYAADADEVRVDAVFRDPAGVPVGSIALTGPAPAERGNATNLLARRAAAAIPPRTRAVDVELTTRRVGEATERYTDGYADNVTLELSVPGVSVPGPVDPGAPVVPGLRPFAGPTVLTGRPPLSSKGAVRVELACESATVGRCSGTLELRAVPRRRRTAVRIARFGVFSIRPGGRQIVTMKLLLARRRAFLVPRSFPATLLVVARDGQGLERRKTVPVRVARRTARRR